MKKLIPLLLFVSSFYYVAAQNNADAERMVLEGIALHDKGDYDGAIKKYDEALKLDKNYFDAYYEKSYSLYALGKAKDCLNLSKDIIKKFPEHPMLNAVYIQYGSVLDDMGRPKDAIEVYDEGIKKFPNDYLLYFNKGLTFQKLGRVEEALIEYQHALKLKPLHSSSNYYTGMLLQGQNKIPALLAYCTFLAIEPNSKRSKDGLVSINSIIGMNIKKEGNNNTIFLDVSGFDKKKNPENNFSTVEFMFSLVSTSKEIDSLSKTPADKLSVKLQMLINSLDNKDKENKGFYWEHYAPFFQAMKEKDHVGTLARLIYLSSGDEENTQWVADNEKAVEEFYDWIKAYKWK